MKNDGVKIDMSYLIRELLKKGKELLMNNEIDSREARLLLAYSMDISSNDLIKYEECTKEQYQKYIQVLNRRCQGEPFAYIAGTREFMKLNFKVNQYTLIPREDTEIVVEKALEVMKHLLESRIFLKQKNNKIRVLDMCTGSGCIAVSIAKYFPHSIVEASDISKEALLIASENAFENQVKVNFIYSNLFENVHQKYDVIIANPPYIESAIIKTLQREVQKEPVLALDGGMDGLEFYRRITKDAKQFLTSNGVLIYEIGFQQGMSVSHILEQEGYRDIQIEKDFSGNDRCIIAYLNNSEL